MNKRLYNFLLLQMFKIITFEVKALLVTLSC